MPPELYIQKTLFKGARVPHRLCIKGWHPLRKGVTGATRVPPKETHQTRDPPQPSLLREGGIDYSLRTPFTPREE